MKSRFLWHSFAILIALCAPALAQKLEVITPNGQKQVVTMSGGATINSSGAITLAGVPSQTSAIVCTVDGAGSAITTGTKGDIYIPFACTITRATVLADTTGSIVFDVWKDTYANYPPTIADTITASAKPTISASTKGQVTTLTGWTTSVAAGDTIRFNVDSASTVTKATLILSITK